MRILAVLLLCIPLCAQNPDAAKYAPRAVLLLDATPGVEAVMPMVFSENGQQHLEFIPASKIKESMDKGGKPIRMGDVTAALNEATQRINQLQAENDKLWKVAMKSESIVIQPAPPPRPTQAEIAAQQQAEVNARRQRMLQTWMMLQGMNRPTQPYQLPVPVNPNASRLQTDCTTYRLGDMTHTECK